MCQAQLTTHALQIKWFREQVGVEDSPASLQLDSAGLKKFFSHGIRRFCDPTALSKLAKPVLETKMFFFICCFLLNIRLIRR